MRRFRRLCALSLAGLLTALPVGCGTVQEPRLLRLDTAAPCRGPGTEQPASSVGLARLVRLYRLESLEGLDRTSVRVAENGVLRSLGGVSYEAPPAQLVQQALELALECDPGVRLAGRTSARARPDMELKGRVLAFEVRQGPSGQSFAIEVALSVWSPGQREQLATRILRGQVPLPDTDPSHLARAAQTALQRVVEQALDLVASLDAREGE